MATLDQISQEVKGLRQLVESLAVQLSQSPTVGSSIIVAGLDEISPNLGLVQAGEFRSGNRVRPGFGFSGVRMAYPSMTYGSGSYNIVGANNDVLQFGLRASDGVAIFGGGNVTLDASGVLVASGGTNRIQLQSDGDAFFGSNLAAPATTGFSVFSNAQTYNSESVGAGDVLIGDNTSTKPNLFWDSSEGKLKMRSGTTVIGQMGTSTGLAMTGARVSRTTDQTIATATTTTVQFDTKDYDDASFWNPTTNYCKNPSFEVNVTDDWTLAGAGTRTLDAAQYKVGAKSCRLMASASETYMYGTTGVSVPNGATVSAQCWIRCTADPGGTKATLILYDLTTPASRANAQGTAASNGAWEYLTCSWTNNTGVAKTVALLMDNTFADSATNIYFDACQLELQTAATAYCDGTRAACIWTGTAHNSTSMRVGFVIPTGQAGRYQIGFYAAMIALGGASAGTVQPVIMSSESAVGVVIHAHDVAAPSGVAYYSGGGITEKDLIEGEGITLTIYHTVGTNMTLYGATYAPTHLWLRRVR